MSGPVTRAVEALQEPDPEPEPRDPFAVALALRVPVFERGTGALAKIAALEEFMLTSAYWQGEMNEERYGLLQRGAELQDEWDAIEGWQTFRRGKTDSSVDLAKAQLRPDLWQEMQTIRRRVRDLRDEIDRLERDATKVSRVYTMVSGGG